MNNGIKAFLDGKEFITIESYNETAFYLNGVSLNAYFVSQEGQKLIFKATKEVILGQENIISDDYNNETFLVVRNYVKDDCFDEQFYYDGNDLGPTYCKKYTSFKLWSPVANKVVLKLEDKDGSKKFLMERLDKGVYYVKVNGNLKNTLYTYEVTANGETNEVIDPYCYSANENGKKSCVIDLNDIEVDSSHLKPLDSISDAIIYELSVRDFSMDGSLGNECKGQFNAFLKEGLKSKKGNPIGLDYIKKLGVTHVQLMPVLDFVTVNETNINEKYNWGYDPYAFNILEGSYSSNPSNPVTRVQEFKKLINKFHQNNIRVVLDVVFNHTYYYLESIYNRIVPYYFYLMDRHQCLSNGSFCGNDVDSLRAMSRKYIKDMCNRLISIYHVDGFRFDLMGILDKSLINEITIDAKSIDPSFIVYGEGWDMPSMLDPSKRATLKNQKDLKNISFFNDYFRDTTTGKVHSTDSYKLGYLSGNIILANNFIKAMKGSIDNDCYFDNPIQSINYVECHDNYTLFDKTALTRKNLSEHDRNKIQLSSIASVIFAQGVPFIHCGMEFNRSKYGVENSYNSPDVINMIHWDDVDKYEKNIQAVRDFISLRKGVRSYDSKELLLNNFDAQIINDSIVKLTYVYNGRVLILAFNPTANKQEIDLNGQYNLVLNHYGKVNDDTSYERIKISSYGFVALSK